MFLGTYSSNYGETYSAVGDSIDSVLSMLSEQVGDNIAVDDVEFYSAKPIKVESTYIIIDE